MENKKKKNKIVQDKIRIGRNKRKFYIIYRLGLGLPKCSTLRDVL